jgi:hypothetical protein
MAEIRYNRSNDLAEKRKSQEAPMTDPKPSPFPQFAKALEAYGATPFAQARNIGIKHTTLRDWLNGKVPKNYIALSCHRDLVLALADDVAANPALCPDHPDQPPA